MASDSSSSAQIVDALGTLPTGTPVSEVARRLLDLFTSGSVEPGTRLPSERQLAASLAVGRSAVREALAALEILGIVQVRPDPARSFADRPASCCRRPCAGGC